jgi:glycosyltransferase involved in cell wall biosynthesis
MLKNIFCKPKVWSNKSIVIYCGASWEEWTPPNVLSGIGGSEEAVIHLSEELTKLGWEVTVFNKCNDNAGVYDGVTYRNSYEFNIRDTFNILISWRKDIFRSKKILAKKRLVWLHDIVGKSDYSSGEDYLEKVIVLSKFQKSLLSKELPETRIYVSTNGINLDDFKPSLLSRNPHRMIYTSSYDRGIEHLLMMWQDIRKEVPDAELHLFYGWQVYDEMMKAGLRPKKFRELMTELMKQDGIFEHGRIGHKQLIKEFYKSGVWVYPCHFEEISCISAMKAQACRCVPVCTDYAALNETVMGGVKVNGQAGENGVDERYKEALIKVLKDTEYQEKLRSELPDKEIFSWEKVAKDWDKDLLNV